jgi:hypothetical protein
MVDSLQKATCATCGEANFRCLITCVVCGYVGCGGTGRWACHVTADTTPVCCGPCWRAYEAERSARQTERMWMDAFQRWSVV